MVNSRGRSAGALAAWLALAGVAIGAVRVVAQAADEPAGVSRELAAIYAADQADRREFSRLTPEELRAVGERDRKRRSRVQEIVQKGQLHSAEDYYHAAMVFQHGRTPEEFLLAHELATVAGFKGHKSGRWLSAAALDRFLQAIGRPQRFGTQYRRDGTGPWTQEPYDRSLPDAIRREYGVPSRAEQAEQLDRMSRQAEKR